MKIENDSLIIEEEILEDMTEEFYAAANQENIKKIVVKTADVASSIVQILWCLKPKKEIVIEDQFLEKFFENVAIAES